MSPTIAVTTTLPIAMFSCRPWPWQTIVASRETGIECKAYKIVAGFTVELADQVADDWQRPIFSR
jgi:hypothetical protein